MKVKDYSLDWNLVNTMSKTDLTKLANRYAAAVNRRINTFITSDRKKSGAYKKLQTYEGAPYLTVYGKRASKGTRGALKAVVKRDFTVNELRESLRVFEAYLGSKTSYREGLKEVEREREKRAKEKFGEDFSGNKLNNFLNFLGEKRVAEAMKKGDSDIVVTALKVAYRKNGHDINKLNEEFNEFEARNISYTQWLREMGYSGDNTSQEGWFKI